MRKPATVLIAGFLASFTGCLSFAPVVEEPLRVGNVRDLSPEAMGMQPGTTSPQEALAAYTARQMTGVASDELASPSGQRTAVLGADYQSRVLVFVNDHYRDSILLPTHGLPPYGLVLRLGELGSKPVLWVLYRDPLARSTEPPTLLSFEERERGYELAARATFEALTSEHDGMTQPMLLGSDMTEGVMLVARDKDGALWDTSYLLKMEGDKITMEPQSMMDALRCNCVKRYAMGLPAR